MADCMCFQIFSVLSCCPHASIQRESDFVCLWVDPELANVDNRMLLSMPKPEGPVREGLPHQVLTILKTLVSSFLPSHLVPSHVLPIRSDDKRMALHVLAATS